MGKRGFIYKSKGGIRSRRSDQEKLDLLKEGRIWSGNKCSGSENCGSLFR